MNMDGSHGTMKFVSDDEKVTEWALENLGRKVAGDEELQKQLYDGALPVAVKAGNGDTYYLRRAGFWTIDIQSER